MGFIHVGQIVLGIAACCLQIIKVILCGNRFFPLKMLLVFKVFPELQQSFKTRQYWMTVSDFLWVLSKKLVVVHENTPCYLELSHSVLEC